ncbi:DUF7504 family protein [Halocatena salina]|uniref:Uncharacterized protein n=1 Tax=Halocatena salina TaxID=2934340 RepID=A0A8U0A8Y3_9EURY|nr:hypothetical protein [Halocatena salina]UPM44938.1 hypothetical protein MW046_17920 [Halocatena salina]
MTGHSESSLDPETVQIEAFPKELPPKSTVLIVGSDEPAVCTIGLQALAQYGHAEDRGLVVTTTRSAATTLDTYTTVHPDSDRPSLAFVDTASEHQYVSAPYRDTPVVFVPSPTDIERVVMALSELTEHLPSLEGRHLLIRSLTPLLMATSTARVCTILDRITELPTGTGRCFLGVDYTAHDETTITTLIERVDGVLWILGPVDGQFDCEYWPANSHCRQALTELDGNG